MKAITIYQPWASLIIIGAKRFETRAWKHSLKGSLAIHAGVKKPRDVLNDVETDVIFAMGRAFGVPEQHIGIILNYLDSLPRGAIIGTADHLGCRKIDQIQEMSCAPWETGCWDGPLWISPSENDLLFGDWTPGRYAWELVNARALEAPIAIRGKQGLWEWDERREGAGQ